MSEAGSQRPSYDELLTVVRGVPALAARVALLEAENGDLQAGNAVLRAENAALKRKLGTDSTNSSTPPSQDSLAAKGKRRAQRSQRVRSKDRKPGGQVGRQGSGLMPASAPDRTETAAVPEDCSGCGSDLADGTDVGMSWTQVWDTPAIRLERCTTCCRDETPVNIAHKDTHEDGTPVPGAPHVVTVRTPDERLVSYRALPARTKVALRNLGVLNDYPGYIVRDDYVGWHQFDERAAGVQQCVSHLFRHLHSVLDLHPDQQAWAGETRDVLREAHTAVAAAKDAEAEALNPALLGDLRARYDKAVTWGQATNRHRDWDGTGNHPGYTLAKRLADKVDQVWLFTTAFSVPWTNNCSEQALKSPKLHQKVSGYWHTLTTLGRFCTVRSYLTSACNHGHRAIDAIHNALTGNAWMPPITT